MMYQITDDAGNPLDSKFEVHDSTIVLHSGGGETNKEYTRGLRTLLSRLLANGYTIRKAWVSSSSKASRALSEQEKTILSPDEGTFPASEIFMLMKQRMPGVARSADAKGPGNSEKRISIEVSSPLRPEEVGTKLRAVVYAKGLSRSKDDPTVYLLTWNPESFEWIDLPAKALRVRNGQPVKQRWSCGNTKNIEVGSRVFLLRQAVEPKGIVASGWVTRKTFEDEHWDEKRASKGDKARFIEFFPDALLDPSEHAPLDVKQFFERPAKPRLEINVASSGTRVPRELVLDLSMSWNSYVGKVLPHLDAVDAEMAAYEGEQRRRFSSHRTRERSLRDAKIREALEKDPDGRIRCEVPGCGFDFMAVYGPIGAGFAHVHHLKPLADAITPVRTRLEDLAVVCPNCHAMIHIGGECRPLDTLIPRNTSV